MAAKEKLKFRAARAGEEMRRTGKLVLRAPVLVRAAECVMRLMLGALLAGAEVFGGYAPFGIGMVACSGSGLDGFCALIGACFGYLSFQGFAAGLRYVAASILVFSISFAFFDLRLYRRGWFMPAAAASERSFEKRSFSDRTRASVTASAIFSVSAKAKLSSASLRRIAAVPDSIFSAAFRSMPSSINLQ